MRPSKTRRGFTVAELLIASTISVILLGGIFSLFLVFSRLFHEGFMQMNIESRARYGIEHIAYDVSAAETIAVQSGGDRLDVTIPTTNAANQIVHTKLSYYLNGISVYLNASGTLNPATDERILWAVEKNAGVNLFQIIDNTGTTYRFDRVVLSFKCYDDKNNNNLREPSEPGLDFALEVFPRNS